MGGVQGWQDLLSYTGFHFIAAMKEVPATIVFPEHDDSGLQRKALRHLEALLGLPQACLHGLATLSKRHDVAAPLLSTVRTLNSVGYNYVYLFDYQLQSAKVSLESPDGFERGVHVQLEKEVWGRAGCREFLQKLNFEPSRQDFHGPWVTLSSPVVKLDRKVLHLATTAIVAVFGKWIADLFTLLNMCNVYYFRSRTLHDNNFSQIYNRNFRTLITVFSYLL